MFSASAVASALRIARSQAAAQLALLPIPISLSVLPHPIHDLVFHLACNARVRVPFT